MPLKTLLASVALMMVSSLQAATITTLFNTGVDASGTPLSNGAAEIHYSLVSVPSGQTSGIRVATSVNGFPLPPWLGDDSTSAWVGPAGSGDLSGLAGDYMYRLTFDLTGFNPATALISGQWATDDPGINIFVNGVGTGNTSGSFTAWSSFSLASNFVSGTNTLDFVVQNAGGPTGLRVEMTGDAALESGGSTTPEPSSMVLIGAGVSALALLRRRRA